MRPSAELYSLADPIFFEDPGSWRPREPTFRPGREALPPGWKRAHRDGWIVCTPPVTSPPPTQGWKIHVSATPDNAQVAVEVAARHCFTRGVAFKFLATPGLVLAYNLKYAPRASSGKVVAIYPRDPAELRRSLEELDSELGGADGPYILSDVRYRDGPLHVRYGGFAARYVWTPDGERVLAVERPDGTLVPDERRPVFSPPSWAEVPDVLTDSIDARRHAGSLVGYRVTEAMHFSNAGGVYAAVREEDGRAVVLKEARPHAGLGGDGRDAVNRMAAEAWALRRLAGVPGVPRVLAELTVAGHRYLVLERMPGGSLQQWQAREFPLVREAPSAAERRAYTTRALALADRVGALVGRLHERGIVFADLHPANILVDEDDMVSFVDFESAFDIAEDRRQTMGHAGFTASGKRGRDIDLHALAVLRLWLFLPLTSLLSLAPDKLDDLAAAAERNFELPTGFVAAVQAVAGRALERAVPPAEPVAGQDDPHDRTPPVTRGSGLHWPAALGSMAAAITRAATPGRAHLLFPADLEVFRTGGATFAHGAAGVLWAMRVAGFDIDAAHERWLLARADQPATRPGFLDGAHGVAHVLDLLDQPAAAAALVDRCAELVEETTNVTLAAGMAGIGLNLLHLSTRRGDRGDYAGYASVARRLGERLTAAVDDGAPHGVDRPAGDPGRARNAGTCAGLLRGWSGPALFLLRLSQATGERRWLDAAVRALHRDLDLCVPMPDGSLQVNGGFRALPYLDVGGAGIALVAAELRAHTTDERVLAALAPLSRSCRSAFTADANLFHGRAGLVATLSRLSHTIPDIVGTARVRDQLNSLGWHALAFHGHVSFPGDGCSRLSMDFATGNAGVLVAAASVLDPAVPFLPFLSPVGDAPASQASAVEATPGSGTTGSSGCVVGNRSSDRKVRT